MRALSEHPHPFPGMSRVMWSVHLIDVHGYRHSQIAGLPLQVLLDLHARAHAEMTVEDLEEWLHEVAEG